MNSLILDRTQSSNSFANDLDKKHRIGKSVKPQGKKEYSPMHATFSSLHKDKYVVQDYSSQAGELKKGIPSQTTYYDFGANLNPMSGQL